MGDASEPAGGALGERDDASDECSGDDDASWEGCGDGDASWEGASGDTSDDDDDGVDMHGDTSEPGGGLGLE